MRVEEIRAEDGAGGRRLRARIVWEGARRGPEDLWYETDAAFADDFLPAPEAFLLAALPLAFWWEEERLRVGEPVCGRLVGGLEEAQLLAASWYPPRRPVPIETAGGTAALPPREPRRTAAFVSGGIDSLSMLRANRDTFPLDHPGAIRDGIFLFGTNLHDFEGERPRPERLRVHAEQRARLEAFAARTGWTLLPVRTNMVAFYPDWPSYRDVGFGPGMLAAAHAFRRRFTHVLYASHGHGLEPAPHASHPLLDALYSSSALEVRLAQPCWERRRKVEVVAAWDEALAALQACTMDEVPPPGQANCGRCEKCLRTMVALLALGRLARAVTYPHRDVTPAMAEALQVQSPRLEQFAGELIAPLEARGRHDLAAVIRAKMARWQEKKRRRNRWWRRLGRRWRGRAAAAFPPAG